MHDAKVNLSATHADVTLVATLRRSDSATVGAVEERPSTLLLKTVSSIERSPPLWPVASQRRRSGGIMRRTPAYAPGMRLARGCHRFLSTVSRAYLNGGSSGWVWRQGRVHLVGRGPATWRLQAA